MKVFFTFLICLFLKNMCFAQKPAISESDIENWPKMPGQQQISNDGNYLAYDIVRPHALEELYIKGIMDNFLMEIPGGKNYTFTEDSRSCVYLNEGDSLCVLDLASKTISYIKNVQSFAIPGNGGMPVIAWRLKGGNLVVKNRQTGQEWQYDQVENYSFSDRGRVLLLFQKTAGSVGNVMGYRWVNLNNGRSFVFWRGNTIAKYVMDPLDSKIAFLAKVDSQAGNCVIYEFDPNRDSVSRLLVNEATSGIEARYSLGFNAWNKLQYSPDGKRLFFGLSLRADSSKRSSGLAKVDIWNYQDEFLQCDQQASLDAERNRSFWAVFDPEQKKVIRLDEERYSQWGEHLNAGDNDNYLLTVTMVNGGDGAHFPKERPDVYLINTRDGSKTCVVKGLLYGLAEFSPGGKYVYWYDNSAKEYNFYNIRKGTVKTAHAPVTLTPNDRKRWLEKDQGVLASDEYDIWQLDPEGEKSPINFTNGYGRKNKIEFKMVDIDFEIGPPLKSTDTLLLCALDDGNKNNGFFRKRFGLSGDPEKLSMRPVIAYWDNISAWMSKAKGADVYLLKTMRSTEFPKLEVTKDFRSFRSFTNLSPESKVNWLTSELVKWKTFDGRPGQGILYKPENFDSTKKYPILFYFYELLSQQLNKYLDPDWTDGPMNIPWFVSRGYLVFVPDIYYERGDPGKGVYNYVVSAAEEMSRRKWVDPKRMGMHGHSFGGFEVDYLVTKTKLFAAAISADGAADLISFAGQAGFAGCAGYEYCLYGQQRMNVPFWENQQAYISTSAVFGADKVVTPLLIMHNKKDQAVPWSQGVEFFTALRWLGKPSFLLQYDDGMHWVEGRSAIDFTRRATQFFDHYLKGAPAPKWMTEGVPASLKGIDSGLEYSAGR
jgi:dipeptidyl aminopeptidase/acylaminoacyl peptidase